MGKVALWTGVKGEEDIALFEVGERWWALIGEKPASLCARRKGQGTMAEATSPPELIQRLPSSTSPPLPCMSPMPQQLVLDPLLGTTSTASDDPYPSWCTASEVRAHRQPVTREGTRDELNSPGSHPRSNGTKSAGSATRRVRKWSSCRRACGG